MNLSIMQPYIFPYIGYFQLIKSSDKFVIYDNIKYTKRGWINRNRILVNGAVKYFTISLKKGSDFLEIRERYLSDKSDIGIKKILMQISNSYRNAPFYKEIFPFIEKIFLYESKNLFEYIFNSVKEVCNLLDIKTEMIVSSEIQMDHSLKSESRVIEINKKLNSDTYINPIGGLELYSRKNFDKESIKLKFIKSHPVKYNQFDNKFMDSLSIIDVLMFNDLKTINSYLNNYELI